MEDRDASGAPAVRADMDLPWAAGPGPIEGARLKILRAAGSCVARWGMSKTTVDDIAHEAGCSRATVYRAFPGGKEEILAAVVAFEEGRFFAGLTPDLEQAGDLTEMLVVAITEASRFVSANAVLAYLMEHEPETVLPHLSLDRIGPLLYRCSAFLGPHLERFIRPEIASEVAEWAVRVVLAYWLQPSDRFDLRREDDTRMIVTRYLLPGLAGSPGATRIVRGAPTTT